MRLSPHPVLPIDVAPWWRYVAQMPPGVVLYVVPILIGLLMPQGWIRTYLLVTSLVMIWLTYGYGFTAAILAATLAAWLMCLGGRWVARHRPAWSRTVLIGGWGIANAVYFSMFLLPVNEALENATHLEVLLLCGPAFLLIRVLGLFTDVCRGGEVGSLRLDRVALFALFAPTFRLGPVTRYAEMNEQFDACKSRVNGRDMLRGALYIAAGVIQLLIIDKYIDRRLIRPFHDQTTFFLRGFFTAVPDLSYYEAVRGMYLVAFRFLFAFWGYSCAAIGLGLLIGIRLPRNFDWPYLSENLQLFWRRWHMSLGQWLRDYVYIPLGGCERRALSTFIVFLYCCLWHQPALNMVLFGVLHAGGLMIHHGWRTWSERHRIRFLTRGPVASAWGGLLTFHFWCLTLLVMFDPDHCGWGAIKRIFIDPFMTGLGTLK